MGIFSKLFSHKNDDKKVGGMEDYMTLVRVYFQAALASQLGITNLAMLPDLRVFKTSLHVPTVNNRLGIGEKAQVKKMMKNIYDTDDSFFKEIDSSIRKNCQKLQDVNVYLIQFQNFTQDLMMLMGNLMKFKLRLPSFMKNSLYKLTAKTVDARTSAQGAFRNHSSGEQFGTGRRNDALRCRRHHPLGQRNLRTQFWICSPLHCRPVRF